MGYDELLKTIDQQQRADREKAELKATKRGARARRREPRPAPPFPCPKCGVASGMPCRSKKGYESLEPHAARLAPLASATEPKDAGKRRRGLKLDTLRG